MDVTFREADLSVENDTEHIVTLLSMFSEESSFPRKMPESTKLTLISNLRKFPTTQVYFAECDNVPVGIAVCYLLYSTFQDAPILNLHDLYIRKSYQGEGIGKKLLEYIELKGKALGCCRVTLEVYQRNFPAVALYESLSYSGGQKDSPEKIMHALYKSLE
jgi:GNAT superfamily N-acetyltransferase